MINTTPQPAMPAPILGLTSFTAPYAGAVTRPFASKLGDVFSAADFGFTPTNTADGNLAAWGMMIAAAQARGGGEIRVTPGTYDVSDTLVIEGRRGLRLMGYDTGHFPAGPDVLIRCTNPDKDVIWLKQSQACSLEGLKVGYTGHGSLLTYALRMTNVVGCSVRDCSFWPGPGTQTGNGILVEPGTSEPALEGVSYLTRIERCDFINLAGHGITLSGADLSHFVLDTTINDCRLINNVGEGLRIFDHVEGVFLNGANNFYGNARALHAEGTSLDSATRNIVIGSGTILDTSDEENIRAVNVTRLVVHGSWISVSGHGRYSAALIGCAKSVINGCEVYFGAAGGVLISGGSENALLGNAFDFNPESIRLDATTSNCRILGNVSYTDPVPIVNLGTHNVIGPNLLTLGVVHLADLEFYTRLLNHDPTLSVDAGDFLQYVRSANQWTLNIASQPKLVVDADLTRVLSLAVGNHAGGSSLGTLIGKLEIFDFTTGASVGFLPIYNEIT